jgi:hypothetical protein
MVQEAPRRRPYGTLESLAYPLNESATESD